MLGESNKTGFRVKRPKQDILELNKENFTVNYSDVLQLQKGLRPIANYNESKMITRYSTENPDTELDRFQFKYQNGRLVFNHEFYLRSEE